MTEEEMRSKMEFIVYQQAQFAANVQELQEAQAQLVKAQERSEARMERIENVVVRLANHTEERLVALTERMESGFAVLNENWWRSPTLKRIQISG